jgi:hypothetical protein
MGQKQGAARLAAFAQPRGTLRLLAALHVVRVVPVIDVEDVNLFGVVVDRVSHAVFAAPCAPVVLEWGSKRRSDPARFLRKRSTDELITGPGDRVRRALL